MIEMDETHPENNIAAGRIVLRNVGGQVGIARSTGNLICTVICSSCTLNTDLSFSRILFHVISSRSRIPVTDLCVRRYADLSVRYFESFKQNMFHYDQTSLTGLE